MHYLVRGRLRPSPHAQGPARARARARACSRVAALYWVVASSARLSRLRPRHVAWNILNVNQTHKSFLENIILWNTYISLIAVL